MAWIVYKISDDDVVMLNSQNIIGIKISKLNNGVKAAFKVKSLSDVRDIEVVLQDWDFETLVKTFGAFLQISGVIDLMSPDAYKNYFLALEQGNKSEEDLFDEEDWRQLQEVYKELAEKFKADLEDETPSENEQTSDTTDDVAES